MRVMNKEAVSMGRTRKSGSKQRKVFVKSDNQRMEAGMQATMNEVKGPVEEQKKSVVEKIPKPTDPNFYTYIQMVEKKAYELYEKRGCQHGRDCEDWFEAEKLVEDELCQCR